MAEAEGIRVVELAREESGMWVMEAMLVRDSCS